MPNVFLQAFARELIARKCENVLSRLTFINKILNQSPDTNSLLSWSPRNLIQNFPFSAQYHERKQVKILDAITELNFSCQGLERV